MQTLTKALGMTIATVAVVAAMAAAPAKTPADDAMLVSPAIYQVSSVGPSVQLVGWRWGPAGYGYYRPYRPYRADYGPYHRAYYGYPAYGYSYPSYGYAYPAYSYPVYGPGVRVGVSIW
jgi:hypothetical protein